MKRLLVLCVFILAIISASAQTVPFPKNPGMTGKFENWGYTNQGTNWDTSPFLPFIYNGLWFRMIPPQGVTYNSSTKTWNNPSGKKYPIILFFAGNGEISGTSNNLQLANGGQYHRDAVLNGTYPGFALFPQNVQPTDMKAITEEALVELPIDINRIYVHGLSGGGVKVWSFMIAYPTLVAAAFPMSAASDAAKSPTFLYQPIRLVQGTLDTNPSPGWTQTDVDYYNNNGGHLEYFLLPGVGHGTWNYMYSRPDFFPWFLSNKKNSIEVRFNKNLICPGQPVSVDMGFTPGFDAYQWSLNGTVISGATNYNLIATQFGSYTGRIMNRGVWSDWSDPVVVGTKLTTNTPPIQPNGLVSTVLPAPDGSTTTQLSLPSGYQTYQWKNAANQVVSASQIYTNVPVGSYTATVSEFNGCSTIPSPLFNVINATGPNSPDAIIDFLGYATSSVSITLGWADKPSPAYNETGFEVYRATSQTGPYSLISIVPADVVTYQDANLIANTTYYYQVRPVNQYSAAPASNIISILTQVDNIPPTAPSNLVGNGGSTATSISLTWTASTDNVGVFRYDIYRNGVKELSVPGTSTSATIYNLTSGQFYSFTVKARDMAGNISTESNIVHRSDYVSGLTYKYYEAATTFGPNLPDFTTLTPAYSGISSNVDITVARRTTNYAIMWQGNINIPVAGSYTFGTTSDDGSKLYIGGYGETYKVVDNDGSHGSLSKEGTKVFSAPGVYPIVITYYQGGGSYAMSVYWKNTAAGQIVQAAIPSSAFATAVLPDGSAPLSPTGLSATAVSFSQINLGWTDNSSNESGFRIYRSTSNTGPFVPIASVPTNTTTYQDIQLSGGTTYYYRVTSYGTYGESALSSEIARGLNYSYYEAPSFTSLSLLSSLLPLNAGTSSFFDPSVRIRSQNMALVWTGQINITTAGTYTFYSASDDGSLLFIDNQKIVSNDFNQNLTERNGNVTLTVGWHNISVQWRKNVSANSRINVSYIRSGISKTLITAINGATLFFGPEVNATTLPTPPAPAVPTNLTATNPVPSTIVLNWQDNATNETSYQVLRSYKQNTNYVTYATLAANTTTFQDAGVFANAQYYYKVQAIGAGGISVSTEVSLITGDNPPILSAIPNANLKFGLTLDIDVLSTDPDKDPIVLSIIGLPAFATFVDHTDGSGNIHFAPTTIGQVGQYPLIVTAQDNHGGVTTTSFTLTVSSTGVPIIQPITNATVNEGQTQNMLISATSDAGPDNLIWAFTGLPAFATYSIVSGLCTITLAPSYTDSGPYTVGVTVTDQLQNSTQATFSINVINVDPNTTIYARVMSSVTAPAPWNNITGLITSSLLNSAGSATPIGLQFNNTTWQTYWMGASTGNNSGIYPDQVLQDYFYFGFNGAPNTVTATISGLDITKTCDLTFFASSVFNLAGITDNGTTQYTVNGQTVSLPVQGNTSNVAMISMITPNPDGTINFTMNMATGTPVGYLNSLVIQQIYQEGTVPVPPRNVMATATSGSGAVNISWIDAPFNEDGYDIYRSTSPTGPFVKIDTSPIAKNSTTYVDNTATLGGTYYYQLTAFNTYGVSTVSNETSITVVGVPPTINVSGNLSVTQNSQSVLTITTSSDAVISLSGLPGFATTSTNSPYNVTVTLQPTISNFGTYTFTATALNSQGLQTSQVITITVTQPVLYSIAINFSSSTGPVAPAPWNNTAKTPALNDVFSNLKDNNSNPSGVNLTLQTAFGGVYNQGGQTGNNSGIVPDAVLKEYYWFGFSGAASDIYMKVSGLSLANAYRFKFVASSTFTNNGTIADNGSTMFSIGTKSASVAVQGNTSGLGVIDNITTNQLGEVVIHVSKGANATVGYVNGMIIEALPPSPTQFDPTGLVASGYSKTQVNLSWNDNSPIETGYEVQRSDTGTDGTWAVVSTTGQNVTNYIDQVSQGGKLYYYKVRALTATGPSNFTNVASSGSVSFKVYVHTAGSASYDAPAPWNNTSRFGYAGDVFYGFKDDTGNNTGIMMLVSTSLEGANSWGMNTGNNSGIFPDKVLIGFWFNDAYFPQGVFVVDGLDQQFGYNFGFLGSISTPNIVNTNFTINGTTVTNRNDNNISNVSYIRNVVPDGNSQVTFTVKEAPGSPWSIWNAMVIEAFPVGKTGGAASGGRIAGNTRSNSVTGNMKEVRYGLATDQLTVYPNPAESVLNLSIKDSSIGDVDYQVLNMMGQEVGKGQFNNGSIDAQYSIGLDIPPAVYLIKVSYPGGGSGILKFVKK